MSQSNRITADEARELRKNNDKILNEIYEEIRKNTDNDFIIFYGIPSHKKQHIISVLTSDGYEVTDIDNIDTTVDLQISW